MSSIETTELKLRTTPTGGVDASHSPYYRRLLSAGYKGFLQGTIGGASLYGTFGLVIGGLAAIAAAPVVGAGALALIPAAAGVGLLKGASTFGAIGSTAAINAESADLSEQRRYLLDRYYDLPEGAEGDKEAEAIRKELSRNHETQPPPHMFHWKTVAICAAAGAAIAFGFMAFGGPLLAHAGIVGMIEEAIGAAGIESAAVAGLTHAASSAIGACMGALTGAVVGVDRYYVRKWFDHTEGVVHSSSHKESALRERSAQVERIKTAAKEDEKIKVQPSVSELSPASAAPQVGNAATPAPIANLDKPNTKISEATLQRRLVDLQKSMEVAAL